MKAQYVIGLDQSTQGTKAILLDRAGEIAAKAFLPHGQIISPEGWVSHDGEEIYRNSVEVIRMLLEDSGVDRGCVAAIGISNQRETTIAWDTRTGIPAEPAIVWQCSRASEITDGIRDGAFRESVREKTGIPLSPYFPAAKAAWLLKHSAKVRELAESGRLALGTIDSWLVFKMTEGRVFRTDYSNASRTQLFNIRTLAWDEEILRAFGIPAAALPEVSFSDGDFGATTLEGTFEHPVPVRAVLGDSHAALFGQGCLSPGMAKATFGTGSSIMMNVGSGYRESKNGLAASLAWGRNGRVDYVLEGNVNYAGAVITWLRDDLGLIAGPKETAELAEAANPEDETYLVPAFSGLGAPYWNDEARAAIVGMSRTTGRREIVKAALESIAFQVADVTEAMSGDAGVPLAELRVDGGPTGNRYLMQFAADVTRARIRVPKAEELSAMGAAFMAGIGAGVFDESVVTADRMKTVYAPQMDEETRTRKMNGWHNAVRKA